MFKNFTAFLALYYCRRELTFLSMMLIAVPIALICRGCSYYLVYSGERHQQKAIQLFKQGPDLIAIQLDYDLDITRNYNQQLKSFPDAPILASQKNYNIIYGRPYYDGTILDIIDVPLQRSKNLPAPNVIERATDNDNSYRPEIVHRLFYVFQGKNALNEANDFLRQYANSEILCPDDDFTLPDSNTGIVDRPWITRFKFEPSYVSARMWWGKTWFLNSNNKSSLDSRRGDYVLSRYNHREYMAPIIKPNMKLRKIN